MATNYPAAIDTNATLHVAVNDLSTTLSLGYTAPGTTLDLTDAALFPSTGGIVYVENDRGTYTGKTGNQLTGVNGLASNHASGVICEMNVDAEHHNNSKDAIIAIQTEIGESGSTTVGTVQKRIADLESTDASLGDAAFKNTGTIAGTVAAGDHAHNGIYEPAFSKNTAFNKNFGTSAGSVAAGDHNHNGVYEPVDANIARKNAANQYSAQQNFAEATLADAANISWNLDAGQIAGVTLAGNRTLDNPTNMVAGGTYILRVTQDATGGRTLAFGTAFKWPGGSAPTLSTTANAIDILTFVSDGTSMFGVAQFDFK